MENTSAPAAKPVVDPVSMPKMEVNNERLSKLNAFAIATSTFFGWAAIFTAIAGFTKKWSVGIPIIGNFLGIATGYMSTPLLVGFLTVACAVFALVTLRKLTDLEAVKKAWSITAAVSWTFAGIFVVEMVALAIYALMAVGSKGVKQQYLWLNGFLPTFIMALGASAVALLSSMIAKGKTNILRIFSIIAICVAGVALILAFIQVLVGLYGKNKDKSYDDYDLDDYSSLLEDLVH